MTRVGPNIEDVGRRSEPGTRAAGEAGLSQEILTRAQACKSWQALSKQPVQSSVGPRTPGRCPLTRAVSQEPVGPVPEGFGPPVRLPATRAECDGEDSRSTARHTAERTACLGGL